MKGNLELLEDLAFAIKLIYDSCSEFIVVGQIEGRPKLKIGLPSTPVTFLPHQGHLTHKVSLVRVSNDHTS